MEEEGTELPLGADALRHTHGELRRVVVGDVHVAGPLAGEDRVGRRARHLTKHDVHGWTFAGRRWPAVGDGR
jgi:hypothetical protein